MNFLLDTNVVSEWVKPSPDPGLARWLAEADEDRIFISVVTLAELRYGIERMAGGRRRDRLTEWIRDEVPDRFEQRILPIDASIADEWGKLLARAEAAGRPLAAMDAFIAATAVVHSLTLVTRNRTDFETVLSAILSPWTS